MNKKLMIGVVIVAIGVGGYILYKRSKPSRQMFDKMVDSCQPPCDVFDGITEGQKDKLYKGFQKLKKEDAQFMVDYMDKLDESNKATNQKFNTLYASMVKNLTTA